MALTNNNLAIIKALAQNDLHAARTAALASLAEDTSKKNEGIIAQYKKLLTKNASTMLGSLPDDLKTILVGESPDAFDVSRYYVREAEKQIVDDIIRMKLTGDELAKRRIPYINTTLLYGKSGTGKTELGRYAAYRLHMPFFYISFVSTIDSYMGSTARNLHKVFEFCSSIPCVLMLDEIDAVAARRSGSGRHGADGEIERTTVALMQELDRLPPHVTLIAATNRLDIVDEALLRRFSICHKVTEMTPEELGAMLRQYVCATDTEPYISESFITDLTRTCGNPGQAMPLLIREIGRGIFAESRQTLDIEEDDPAEPINVWEVTYTWKENIVAETEEDAIAKARKERSVYGNVMAGRYSAKRAYFLSAPDPSAKRM